MTVRELLSALPVFDVALPPFDPAGAPGDPVALFLRWLAEAVDAGVREPHAMTVSTIDAEGLPDARVVTLKDVDAEGWHFSTSRASAKGRQLAATGVVALSFYWREQGRQVRLRGPVVAADPARCAEDFLSRPEASRVAGLVGRQSEVLADPALLDAELDRARRRLTVDGRAVDETHTIYTLHPRSVEFWQGEEERRHIRLRYLRAGGTWTRDRLWP